MTGKLNLDLGDDYGFYPKLAKAAAEALPSASNDPMRTVLQYTARESVLGQLSLVRTTDRSLFGGEIFVERFTRVALVFTADPEALDGPWGFMAVQGGGCSPEKLSQGFGKALTIVEPGISIKPYPSGMLTHPTIDLLQRLVIEGDVKPEDIDTVTVHSGTNVLKQIRYPIAANHLQAKFSLPAALSMIALARKAGKVEFSDAFVGSDAMQAMQRQMRTELDPENEAKGFDKMRSRITITLKDGKEIADWADERYRGGPAPTLNDGEIEDKERSCCDGVLNEAQQNALLKSAWGGLELEDAVKPFQTR